MTRQTRPISWIKGARSDFEKFPAEAQTICLTALTIAAENGKADIAKPFKGVGSGVFEIALPFRENAFRVIYAVQIASEVWVIHAFHKKSTQGIKPDRDEGYAAKDGGGVDDEKQQVKNQASILFFGSPAARRARPAPPRRARQTAPSPKRPGWLSRRAATQQASPPPAAERWRELPMIRANPS